MEHQPLRPSEYDEIPAIQYTAHFHAFGLPPSFAIAYLVGLSFLGQVRQETRVWIQDCPISCVPFFLGFISVRLGPVFMAVGFRPLVAFLTSHEFLSGMGSHTAGLLARTDRRP